MLRPKTPKQYIQDKNTFRVLLGSILDNYIIKNYVCLKRNFTLIKLSINSLIFITTELHKNLPSNSVYPRHSGPDAGNIIPVWSLCLCWDCASFFPLWAYPPFSFFFFLNTCANKNICHFKKIATTTKYHHHRWHSPFLFL